MKKLTLIIILFAFWVKNTLIAQLSGTYFIQNINSGKVIDVPNGSNENGTKIIQWVSHNSNNHKWKVIPIGGGYFNIINLSSNKCLDVPTFNEGEFLTQYNCIPNNDNQKWKFELQSDGSYLIISKKSGKLIDVINSNTENGNNIVQNSRTGGNNQRWFLKPTILKSKGDVFTNFVPSLNGYHFNNQFEASYALIIPVHGLCGGMIYSSLDYLNSDYSIPSMTTKPADHTTLTDYIYNRWKDAYESNFDKWAELTINPFGARNDEFFNWGLQNSKGGRIQELKQSIDNGKSIPLGLFHIGNGGIAPHHVVLAIGYNMGKYSGNLNDCIANKETFKIYVYNPNKHDSIDVLRVNVKEKYYYLESNPSAHYLSYFVDKKYAVKIPPKI